MGSCRHVRLQSGVASGEEKAQRAQGLGVLPSNPILDVTHSVLMAKPTQARIGLGKSPAVPASPSEPTL